MTTSEIPKSYDPKTIENDWSEFWIKENLFVPLTDTEKLPFAIVIPPPNVTGSLHMGHALNSTLQDVIIRWKKMCGFKTLWVPGTDHGGIATQNVVEKIVKGEKKSRDDLGREKFIERMWQWRKESGETILNQLKRLGCSLDWNRARFTMDSICSKAVFTAFTELYSRGWIYRGKRMVNWCVRCRTALSEIEVEYEERKGKLYHIRYPILSGVRDGWQGLPLIVATTRPETMLGDSAVAVHPEDPRYEKIQGWWVQLPLVEKEIPIIQDHSVDPKFGTGVVKVTPAHDPTDFEIGERHHLAQEVVIGFNGKMSSAAGKFASLSREECRKKVVEELEKQNLIEKIEDYHHSVGTCYRCGEIIEPLISDQWFLKVDEMAKEATEVTLNKMVRIFPDSWEKPYLNWLKNLKDWCISRQIWWGHRIPIWYCVTPLPSSSSPEDHPAMRTSCPPIASIERAQECPKCRGKEFEQDPDVLDTWFSSALWPFSVFGWPDSSEDIKSFYPTSLLVTGHEILYLWVARMVMFGLTFAPKGSKKIEEKIPFRQVFIHGIVRDKQGKKMSKSLGNVVDPLFMIEKYGTDALRFALTLQSVPGRDMQISDETFVGARNFVNKIWNANRFILTHIESQKILCKGQAVIDFSLLDSGQSLELCDRWILSRFQNQVEKVTQSFDQYNFAQAARTLYQFLWNEFCDWYLELSKIRLIQNSETKTADSKGRTTVLSVLAYILSGTLRLLHPILPFVTEELWKRLNGFLPPASSFPKEKEEQQKSILLSSYPEVKREWLDGKSETKMDILISLIVEVRTIRSEMNVPPAISIPLFLKPSDKMGETFLREHTHYIQHLCRSDRCEVGTDLEKPEKSASAMVADIEIFVPLEGLIDFSKERIRLEKEVQSTQVDLERIEKRMSDKNFMGNAPQEEVTKTEKRKKIAIQKLARLKEHLTAISRQV